MEPTNSSDQSDDTDITTVLDKLWDHFGSSEVTSLEPALPLLRIEGKPFTLKNHFMFRPMFLLQRAKRRLFLTARQMGKSHSMASSNLLLSNFLRWYNSLFVCPRHEQIKRLSVEIMRPLLLSSVMQDAFFDKTVNQDTVMVRSYASSSKQVFSFAFLDPNRVRSIFNISEVNLDEIQDINFEFLPVIGETMSAARDRGFYTYTGTPKSLDNTAHQLWKQSSQAEWITKCQACNTDNVACTDWHLLKMIGKDTVVCHKCGKPLECSTGTYVHRYRDRIHSFSGFHASQITHPFHYNYKSQWDELHYKINHYPTYRLYNEVFGEAYDSADRMITEDDLRSACGKWVCSLEEALKRASAYDPVVIGVDWSGGGLEGHSYTSVGIGGRKKSSDHIDILWGTKLPLHISPREQARFICYLYGELKKVVRTSTLLFAHDFTGAGYAQEHIVVDAGLPPSCIVPFTYVLSPKQAVIHESLEGSRRSFSLDKPRSLVILCAMIKAGKVRFPEWNSQKMEMFRGLPLVADFLHLFSEVSDRPHGGDVYLVKKEANTSDDFAHTVNFIASACWFYHQNYPDLAEALHIRVTQETLDQVDPHNPEWFKLTTNAVEQTAKKYQEMEAP